MTTRNSTHARRIDWSKADWTLRNAEIAKALGAAHPTVSNKRKEVGAPRPRHEHTRRAKLEAIDWTKRNTEIAEEVNLSSERVRQIRKELRAPRPKPRPILRRKTLKALRKAQAILDNPEPVTPAQAAKVLGHPRYQPELVYQLLKANGRIRIEKHPWHKMNFDLPDRILRKIWKLPISMVGPYRRRKRLQRPKWRSRHNSFDPGAPLAEGPEFQMAVEAEKRKARAHYEPL